MARIPGAPTREAGQDVALTHGDARGALAQLAGRETARMIEPLEPCAHVPGLPHGCLAHEPAAGELDRVDTRLEYLAELKAAALTNCEYCTALGSQIARRSGLSDELLLALPPDRTSPLFTELETLVLDDAVGMSRTPVDVPDALFAKLREHFDPAQLVEFTHVIALENLRGRFDLALGVGAAGFSEGMVCAVPETVPLGSR